MYYFCGIKTFALFFIYKNNINYWLKCIKLVNKISKKSKYLQISIENGILIWYD